MRQQQSRYDETAKPLRQSMQAPDVASPLQSVGEVLPTAMPLSYNV
ncbi:MAG: hypothetical protein KKC01_09195 [Gammaproteobacteria bacterium]|nr:hypothetical protein [Gammaproteobacteria bacterium]